MFIARQSLRVEFVHTNMRDTPTPPLDANIAQTNSQTTAARGEFMDAAHKAMIAALKIS